MRHIVRAIRKLALRLLAAILLVLLLAGVFFGAKGYGMYRAAVREKTIAERVDEIRSREDFTSYEELPQFYIEAVISVEDHRFEKHFGLDPIAIARALWNDLRTMSFAEGGSTITQQLAKNLLFGQEKRLERKAAEIFAALKLEADYTKEEIFELYVNTAYFGSGYYGVGQASLGYFGKKPDELTDSEAAMLAGIPNAPSVYSPDVSEELALRRTGQVLDSMVRHGILTREGADRISSSLSGSRALERV